MGVFCKQCRGVKLKFMSFRREGETFRKSLTSSTEISEEFSKHIDLAEHLRARWMFSRELDVTRPRHVARQLVSGENCVLGRNLHSKGTNFTMWREKDVIHRCAFDKGDWVHFFILSFSFSSLAAAFAAAFASDLAEMDNRIEKHQYSVK